jgi:hypothetical protein
MKNLIEMGEAARRCSNIDYRATMRSALASCMAHAEQFRHSPSTDNLMRLNGAWAHATRVFKNVPPEATPAPTSGWTEPARLAA